LSSASLDVRATGVLAKPQHLRKQLGFFDLVLACILLVVIPDFFGTAVKAGKASVLFWLLAVLFFFVPQALVVNHLNRKLPVEGGLYEWARIAFGDLTGFLVGWNLWVYVVMYSAAVGLVTTNYLAYMLGPRFFWIGSSRPALFCANMTIIASLMFVTHLGLQVGKWLINLGSILSILTIAVLAALPFLRHARGLLPQYHPLAVAWPGMSLFSLSVFSKMTFGALVGLEYAAIFSGESRNPLRDFPRAILIAVPVVIILYVFGTSSILAFVTPESVDMIGPIPQALQVGFAGLAIGLVLTLIHLVGIPITNTSVNPARSIGPAIFVGGWALQQLWLFIVAPFVGAVLAAIVYAGLRHPAVLITTRKAEQALPGEQIDRIA